LNRGPGSERRIAPRIATVAIFFANGLGIGAWAAALPRLKAAHGLDDAQLSLVLVSFAAGAVVAMPLAGIVGSRIATGRATWMAGLAFALMLALPVLSPSLPLLCLAAILLGAGNGAEDVLMNAHASRLEQRRGAPIMSSFHAAFSLGGAAGALLGGQLGASVPAAGLWGPSAVSALIVLAAVSFLGREGPAGAPAPFRLPSRAMLALGFIAFLCMMIEGAIADWSGTYLVHSQVPVARAALGYAAFSAAMVLGRLTGDAVVARLGQIRVVAAGGVLAAVGLLVLAAVPGLATGAAGFALVGLGLANVVPAVFSIAGRTETTPAAGVAMAATTGYGGFLLGPVAIGAIASAADLRWGMVALAVAAVLVTTMALRRRGR
jgi:MFS family permease